MNKSQAQMYKEAEVQATYDKHRNTDGNTQFAATYIEAGLGYVDYASFFPFDLIKITEAEFDQLQAKFDALPCFKPKSSKALAPNVVHAMDAAIQNSARPQFDDLSAYPERTKGLRKGETLNLIVGAGVGSQHKTALVPTLPNPKPFVLDRNLPI